MTHSNDDRRLGLDRPITRRDFMNGATFAIGTAAAGWPSLGSTAGVNYPPASVGMRGLHAGSFEVMHAVRDGTFWATAGKPVSTDEQYDLIVVGAGISGLAAAQLYRRSGGKKILLLENLADFGGHAQRNEFTAANGRRVIGYGGSQSLQSPSFFSAAVRELLTEIGIDTEKFRGYFDSQWAAKRKLGNAVFFSKETFGVDRLVRTAPKAKDWVQNAPLSDVARADLIELLDAPRDYLAGRSRAQKLEQLSKITYADFLVRVAQKSGELVSYFQSSTQGYFGVGIDATTALDAWANGNPGFDGMDLGTEVHPAMSPSGRLACKDPDPYIFHFPDGNAGVARALVRALIPSALPGTSMEEITTGTLSYDELDRAGHPVRIRLRSPVVRVKHLGEVGRASAVEVTYVEDGKLKTATAGHVVLACWHRVIPYLTNELPSAQVAALGDQQKVPLLYTNVLLRNWRAFERLGIRGFSAPQSFWSGASIDFPVSMGSYRFAESPDDPVLLHLSKVVLGDKRGLPAREQALAGRKALVNLTFEQLEREIRDLLNRGLAGGGFDAARDIEAITVNRWSHGYAYEYMRPWDAFWPAGPLPIETARRPWGRIAIANSDSGAYAYAHSAIDQAARAVKDLLGEPANIAAHATIPGPPLEKLGL